ncbi:MAG TPA: hypothetical protein VKA60_24260 [Blastocatellia bacterium]|nr:hypothetical protein [Blastocatellia bacterium]
MKGSTSSQKWLRAAGLLVLLFGVSMAVDAQRGRWQSLGTAFVDGGRDHDVIRVRARGAFTALQLGIKGGEIEFQRVVVHFENGGQQELEVRDHIRAGGKTRVIDLNGERRRIDSVEFWYGKPNWRSRPRVQLWGRR